jgi:hypothetical protein
MAVTLDARSAGAKTSGATSLSYTHTVGTLTNGVLVVPGTTGAVGGKRISTVVWDSGGTNAGLTNEGNFYDGAAVYAELWYIKAPLAGTRTILITPASSCEMTGGAASYQFVNQTTPWNAASPQTGTGTVGSQPSLTVTSATNEMVVACIGDDENSSNDTIAATSGTTIHSQAVGAGKHSGASSDAAGAASVAMSYSGVGAGNSWTAVGGSLKWDGSGGGGASSTASAAGIAASTADLHAKRKVSTSAAGVATTTVALHAKRLVVTSAAGQGSTSVTCTKVGGGRTATAAGVATTAANLNARRLVSTSAAGAASVSVTCQKVAGGRTASAAGVGSAQVSAIRWKGGNASSAGAASVSVACQVRRGVSIGASGSSTVSVTANVRRALTVSAAGAATTFALAGTTTVTTTVRRGKYAAEHAASLAMMRDALKEFANEHSSALRDVMDAGQ